MLITLDRLQDDDRDEVFHVEVTDEWVFYGRVFGGYVAALSGRAALRALGAAGTRLLSVSVTFVSSVRPGEVRFRTRLVRRMATMAIVQVEAEQGGSVRSIAQVRFGRRDVAEQPVTPQDVPAPEDCVVPRYVRDNAAFLAHFDERAIDFPLSHEEFKGGPPRIELWSRPRVAEPEHGQLHDLMVFDSHLLDSVFRVLGWVSWGVRIVSLDLNVVWFATESSEGWRRLRAVADIAEDVAVIEGSLFSEKGTLIARASSQVAILQR
ncbi:MAG TPA: acyl-CoA thioesterase domain-containing protein [Thermomonospora sp.]|nr:acyl-CoA thioesterase domain-containing protein [Thermomonospora sp.]